MFRPRVIPCLLLKDKGLVKTINFGDFKYIGDPMNAIKIFNDFEADELVFLDIDATKEGRVISKEFVKKISEEAFMPFAVGGGITKINEIKELFSAGAEKVIIGSKAIENMEFIKEASEVFGSQSIIVCIDVKKIGKEHRVFIRNGEIEIKKELKKVIEELEKSGVGEIIVNSIDQDGMMEGYDLGLISQVSKITSVPLIALGGAGSMLDLNKAITQGASAVSCGSLFIFSGKNKGILINYPEKEEFMELFNKDKLK
jgi:imidazole glycerol-phosphate synthase subunit HisF